MAQDNMKESEVPNPKPPFFSLYAPYIEQEDVEILPQDYFYHDCRENVLHNFFNNLLFDPFTQTFDVSRLRAMQQEASSRQQSTLIDKVIAFYEERPSPLDHGHACDGVVDPQRRLQSATVWADICSSLAGVSYWWPTGRYRRPFTLGDTHEINAGIGNYLRVFCHLFGYWPTSPDQTVPIFNFDQLSEAFARVGFQVRFQPSARVPQPCLDPSQSAQLHDVAGDNHDQEVLVWIDRNDADLLFVWRFTIGHLEVYHTSDTGELDHPYSRRNKVDYRPVELVPTDQAVVDSMMAEWLDSVTEID
eukprot:TRINITY_DN17893_c0_g2_i2.p1 TRINITY_DN17893_c0_g2~~TRINITY_DN17893_c0_g2_i2.p1  ORF type:complete len:330 (+),score=66.47 TRINITY_DN17893_c0_g2_i2:79-990(+)